MAVIPLLLRPYWLLAFIIVALFIWWIFYKQAKVNNWSKICDAKLLDKLLLKKGAKHNLPIILLALVWFLVVIALSGPSWTKIKSPVFQSTSTTVILLDLSNEMLAQDPSPDRLTRAKFKIEDILKQEADRRFGLSVFSQSSFTVSPVTSDSATLLSMVSVLEPDLLPVAGRNVANGLAHASDLLMQSGQPKGNILLITTGSMDKAAVEMARIIKSKGMSISVLGIGSETGAPVPTTTGFVKENNGVKLSKLDIP